MPANNNNSMRNMALPFMLESSGIRGHLVRLNEEVHTILTNHKYPVCVSQLLAEMLILAAMIAQILKPKGMVTIQAQGEGAIGFISADHTPEGHLRGYAHLKDRSSLNDIQVQPRAQQDITELFGKGLLVITIENIGERPYQAIVPLEGKSLSLCVADFFRRSGQLDVHIETAAMKINRHWHAGGIVLQSTTGDEDEPWVYARTMLQSAKDKELVDDNLPPYTLLYRLFNEAGVRVFDEQKLVARCRCSRERMHDVLMGLTPEERQEMTVEGIISMTCHFCHRREEFVAE